MIDSNTNTDDNTPHECGLSAQAVDWVREHGSAFLRFCVEKGDFCRHRYNAERAQLEAPGWSLLNEAAYPPLNPPAEAMKLLTRARQWFPLAHLWQVYGEGYVEYVVVADAIWPDCLPLVSDNRIRVYIQKQKG